MEKMKVYVKNVEIRMDGGWSKNILDGLWKVELAPSKRALPPSVALLNTIKKESVIFPCAYSCFQPKIPLPPGSGPSSAPLTRVFPANITRVLHQYIFERKKLSLAPRQKNSHLRLRVILIGKYELIHHSPCCLMPFSTLLCKVSFIFVAS